MVSTFPLISKSSSPFSNILGIVPSAPTTIGITVTFRFHCFFCSFAMFRYLSFYSLYSSFTLWLSVQQSPLFGRFSIFVDYHSAWSSGRECGCRLYLKIPEKFVCLILQDGFWVLHIPLVRMVIFKLFEQCRVDYLHRLVMSSLILFRRFFDTYSLSISSLNCKALCFVIKFLVFSSIYPSYTSRMVPSVLWEGQSRYYSVWWGFCYIVWFRIVFSFSWRIIF